MFARSLRDIKTYPNYELDLELISSRKAFRRQYKLNAQDAETAEAQMRSEWWKPLILQN